MALEQEWATSQRERPTGRVRSRLLRVALLCMIPIALCSPTIAQSRPTPAQSFPTLTGTFKLVYNVTKTDVTPPSALQYMNQVNPSPAIVRLPPEHWTVTLFGSGGKLALVDNHVGHHVFIWDGESTTEIDFPSADLTPTNLAQILIYPGAGMFLRQWTPISTTSLAPSITLLRNALWTDHSGKTHHSGKKTVAGSAPLVGYQNPRGPMLYKDATCTLESTPGGLVASSCTLVGHPNPRTNSVTMQVWSFRQYTNLDGVPLPGRTSLVAYGSITELRGRPLPYMPSTSELLSAVKAGKTVSVGIPYLRYNFSLVKASREKWPAEAFSTSYWLRPLEQVSDLRTENTPKSFSYRPGGGSLAEQAQRGQQQDYLDSINAPVCKP